MDQKTIDYLFAHYRVDKARGWLIRKVTVTKYPAGTRAGYLHNHTGNSYRYVWVLGKQLKEHRVIWLLVHGSLPDDEEIDHWNTVKDDNRPNNLRIADKVGNGQNRRRPNKNSTTGVLGVYAKENGFVAKVSVRGKQRKRNCTTLEEARLAYIELKRAYHPFGTL